MATDTVRTGTVRANGTELYHEIRGDGPPIVCIAGATGDAGGFTSLAELLADTHTVVTYDRRGNSRSPKPDGWTTTNVEEQADDCAALIEALGLERPAVFGISGGGLILVGLIQRHADTLRGAIAHEPVLLSVSPETATAFGELMSSMADAADPLESMMRFGRWVSGEDRFEAMNAEFDAQLLERMFGNMDVTFRIESGLMTFVPDADALARVEIPVHASYGELNEGTFWPEGARWLTEATSGTLHALPGAHGQLADELPAFVDALQTILASMP